MRSVRLARTAGYSAVLPALAAFGLAIAPQVPAVGGIPGGTSNPRPAGATLGGTGHRPAGGIPRGATKARPAGATLGGTGHRPAGGIPGGTSQPRPAAGPLAPQVLASARRVCPPPTQPGRMQCMSTERTPLRGVAGGRPPGSILRGVAGGRPAGSILRTAGSRQATSVRSVSGPFGYSPASLRSAYGLVRASQTRGGGELVAIVDAFSDPRAASDLARYRAHYRLPPCTMSSGCLRIVNSRGHSGPLPRPDQNWALEESLDLDMVSALCPHCRILLVEAHDNSTGALGLAENTAVAMGARFVSNSWAGREFAGEKAYNSYFNHPGVAIAFAAGDMGYGAAYPTDIQYVTAVGGTTLHRARNHRGWSETVWPGTGSGCSAFAAKAPWQTADDAAPNGCLTRTGNDVSADANVATGVAIYDTYASGGTWLEAGGTSVATPIVTAIYALAGPPAPRTYPARYPYQHARRLYDVTTGSNGTCPLNRQYLCHAEPGYDGPAGLGTPLGIAAVASPRGPQVTLLDPGTQHVVADSRFSLTITGLDSSARARSLAYSDGGSLPPGLSIASMPGSTNGLITGRLPATAGTSLVTITATDKFGKSASVRFRIVSVLHLPVASG